MTTIIARSALVFYGHKPPPDLARVEIDYRGAREITWADVMRERRERQARRLAQKRGEGEPTWRAVRLWVAYFDQHLMGGWHVFLDDWRGRRGDVWIDRDAPRFKPAVMRLFPCGHLPGAATWEAWRIAFARQYERRRQCRRPVGVAFLWRRGCELAKEPSRTFSEG